MYLCVSRWCLSFVFRTSFNLVRSELATDTPHYSLVAEVPLRIQKIYGEEYLRTEGLKFLVVLREPVSRTISSWEYKSDREFLTR